MIEDGATVPPDHGTTTTAPAPLPPLVDDVRAMQEVYAGNHHTRTTTTITEQSPAAVPPPPPRADDAYTMRDVYADDNANANAHLVRYLDANLKMLKVAYSRRWVADNADPPVTQLSSSTNHTATSNCTWSTTSSEMSASSCRHWLISTIANQVRVILAGRIVNRQEVMCQVMRELSDIFNMAMLPEFKDSIVGAVLEQARPLATL